ncbi:hypothetical protein DFH09DRAFT_1337448 [Mycena vulgaris]|nr:hypothetical protein DFH09DRAFT_1337448 [Mycena vulgaris]
MTSPLAPTFGIWMVALFFMSILLGMGILQVYLYFLWYHKDSWGIKGTVILITLLEVLQTALFFSATYTLLIDGFSDLNGLGVIPWQATTQLLLLYISTFVAQSYFAHCIYMLQQKRLLFPLIIVGLSFVGLGGGIAQFILTSKIEHFRDLPETSAATNTQAALSLTGDILITVGLEFNPINRGVLTMVTAALNMILFLTQPGTFYFMFVLLISGKFYMNSMVAMLNTRQHAHAISRFGQTQTTVDHIAMNSFVPAGNIQGANVSVAHETLNDGSDTGLDLRGDGKLVL